MNGQHTAEPWAWTPCEWDRDGICDEITTSANLCGKDGAVVWRVDCGDHLGLDDDNAHRIVACVNALAGFTTEDVESGKFEMIDENPWGGRSLELLREAAKRGLRLTTQGTVTLQNGKLAEVGKVGPDGYRYIHIGVDGSRAKMTMARIVCFLAHGEPPTPDHVADHIDGDKGNDHPSNLRWATRSENLRNSAANREGEGYLRIAHDMETLRAQRDELAEALRSADCNCTIRERDSGHRVGCWKPDADAALAKVSA